MRVQYVANDGKVFTSKEDCEKHESAIDTKEKRWAEVEVARAEYRKLLKKYNEEFKALDTDYEDVFDLIFNYRG